MNDRDPAAERCPESCRGLGRQRDLRNQDDRAPSHLHRRAQSSRCRRTFCRFPSRRAAAPSRSRRATARRRFPRAPRAAPASLPAARGLGVTARCRPRERAARAAHRRATARATTALEKPARTASARSIPGFARTKASSASALRPRIVASPGSKTRTRRSRTRGSATRRMRRKLPCRTSVRTCASSVRRSATRRASGWRTSCSSVKLSANSSQIKRTSRTRDRSRRAGSIFRAREHVANPRHRAAQDDRTERLTQRAEILLGHELCQREPGLVERAPTVDPLAHRPQCPRLLEFVDLRDDETDRVAAAERHADDVTDRECGVAGVVG